MFGSKLMTDVGSYINVEDATIGQKLKGVTFDNYKLIKDNNPNFADLLVNNNIYAISEFKESYAVIEDISYGYDNNFYEISKGLKLTFEHPVIVNKNGSCYFKSIANVNNLEKLISLKNGKFVISNISTSHFSRKGFTVSIKVSGAQTLISDDGILVHVGQFKDNNKSNDMANVATTTVFGATFNDTESLYFGTLDSYLLRSGVDTLESMQDPNSVLFLNTVDDSANMPGGNPNSFVFDKGSSSSIGPSGPPGPPGGSSEGTGTGGGSTDIANFLGITICNTYANVNGTCLVQSLIDPSFNLTLSEDISCSECFIAYESHLNDLISMHGIDFVNGLVLNIAFNPFVD